jgi:hypothetical protein
LPEDALSLLSLVLINFSFFSFYDSGITNIRTI